MKNKAFTLIELLAVIVILAIIALIAVPMVLGVIEKSKQGAAKDSALGYIDAIEKYIVISETDSNKEKLDANKTYDVNELKDYVVIKGEYPSSGTIKLDEKSKIESANLIINGYEVNCTNYSCIIKGEKEEIEVPKVLHKEAKLNGADPVIKGSLIPVVIENDGTVKKADLYSNWYSYENQKWANAVILKDESVTYEDNAIIEEDAIESYFVWIPRYRYKIFNEGNYTSAGTTKPTTSLAQEIQIEFESKEVTPSTGSTKDSWLTHPAFTTFDVNGMWVGKFETGYDGAEEKAAAQVDSNDSSKVIVKPNVYSWRGITVYNIFTALYNYKRELDSHMMKNTEWGAVAYLSHSKYGINKEVNVNNNSQYKTGYSSTDSADQSDYPGTYGTTEDKTLSWNTETGYKASTTGNITGVYDMSGCADDTMAAYMSGQLGESGFDESSILSYDSKYFDVYNEDSDKETYNNRILGDATGEMGPFNYYADGDGNSRNHNSWYADLSHFIKIDTPWFNRGGNFKRGSNASQFYFGYIIGSGSNSQGSRLVLSFN